MVLGHARGGHGMMTVLLLDVPIEITVKVSFLVRAIVVDVTLIRVHACWEDETGPNMLKKMSV
jgi:hypothetical protein